MMTYILNQTKLLRFSIFIRCNLAFKTYTTFTEKWLLGNTLYPYSKRSYRKAVFITELGQGKRVRSIRVTPHFLSFTSFRTLVSCFQGSSICASPSIASLIKFIVHDFIYCFVILKFIILNIFMYRIAVKRYCRYQLHTRYSSVYGSVVQQRLALYCNL